MFALLYLVGAGAVCLPAAYAKEMAADSCSQRPAVGAPIAEPESLESVNGLLSIDLAIHDSVSPDGAARYCYRTLDGHEAPTLRVRPGDLVILRLSNQLMRLDLGPEGDRAMAHHHEGASAEPCARAAMTATISPWFFRSVGGMLMVFSSASVAAPCPDPKFRNVPPCWLATEVAAPNAPSKKSSRLSPC